MRVFVHYPPGHSTARRRLRSGGPVRCISHAPPCHGGRHRIAGRPLTDACSVAGGRRDRAAIGPQAASRHVDGGCPCIAIIASPTVGSRSLSASLPDRGREPVRWPLSSGLLDYLKVPERRVRVKPFSGLFWCESRRSFGPIVRVTRFVSVGGPIGGRLCEFRGVRIRARLSVIGRRDAERATGFAPLDSHNRGSFGAIFAEFRCDTRPGPTVDGGCVSVGDRRAGGPGRRPGADRRMDGPGMDGSGGQGSGGSGDQARR